MKYSEKHSIECNGDGLDVWIDYEAYDNPAQWKVFWVCKWSETYKKGKSNNFLVDREFSRDINSEGHIDWMYFDIEFIPELIRNELSNIVAKYHKLRTFI